MINRKRTYFFALTLLTVASVVHADSVTLKEGKVLNGRITDESEDEIELTMRSNMFLRISKEKIQSIERTVKASTRPVVTMDMIKAKAAKKPEEKPTATPTVSATPSPVPMEKTLSLKNIDAAALTTRTKKENATFIQLRRTELFGVNGLVFNKPDASHVMMSLSWEGDVVKEDALLRWKELVMVSTITRKAPQWIPKLSPDINAIERWNAYLAGLEAHDKGHLDIYENALQSIAEALAALRAPTEAELKSKSKKVAQDLLTRAEKKQQGHDRIKPFPRRKPAPPVGK